MDQPEDIGGLGIGTEIEGRYRIDDVLGAGGVGAVYRATHLKLDRPVALKVIRDQLCSNSMLRHRFEREARALASLAHPHVVTVTDYGVHDSLPYLVMELLSGETLDERLGKGPLAPDEAVEILTQLLRALSFIHDQGLVHRDLKPGNVFLQAVPGAGPHVKVLDFGLAKFTDPAAGDRAVTRAGEVFGTPSYMAPEQVHGTETDGRTDLYAAGILLFEMLAGRAPFQGTMAVVMNKHLVEPLPKVEDVHPARVASAALDAFLRRATAKDPADRFASAAEMAAALEALPRPLVVADGEGEAFFERPTSEQGKGAAPPGEDSMLVAASRAPRRGARRPLMMLLWAGVALLGAAGGLLVLFRQAPNADGTAPSAAVVPAVAMPEPSGRTAGAPSEAPPPEASAKLAPTASGLPEAPVEPTAPAPPAPSAGGIPKLEVEDVWAGAPKLLLATLEAVDAGTPLSRRSLTYVHNYNRQHVGDPRGHIILARSHLNRGWRKDALNEYAGAIELNPDVRADPRILDDLLTMVVEGWRAANDLIERAYGEAALDGIDARLKTVGVNRLAKTRLEKLRDKLAE